MSHNKMSKQGKYLKYTTQERRDPMRVDRRWISQDHN